MVDPYTFIFIGPSGSGKGTQATLLKQYIKERDPDKREIFYQQTGTPFRDFWKSGLLGDTKAASTITHERSLGMYNNGERQPDFLAVLMWGTPLVKHFKGTEHLFFDGTPRSLNEARILDTALEFYGREKSYVVYLALPREVSIERLLRRGEIENRKDDQTREGIEKRLDWFDEDVLPALDFYRENPRYELLEIDGAQSVPDVQRALLERLDI